MLTVPNLADVRRALHAHSHRRIPAEGAMRLAAVAAVLHQHARHGLEILFIHRAEHPDDPWSGHMAFPGGRVDPEDASPLAAAVRETREELSLDLNNRAELLGELSHLPAIAHGRKLPMVIVPFVFAVEQRPSLEVDPREVQEALWVPAQFLLDHSNRTSMERTFAGVPMTLPCYHYEGRIIWGLTLRMVDELLELLG